MIKRVPLSTPNTEEVDRRKTRSTAALGGLRLFFLGLYSRITTTPLNVTTVVS